MNLRFLSLCGALLLLPLLSPRPAHAEDQTQAGAQELANPFSDFVPFEDEYDVDEDERFMYFGRFFAVSLGSGLHTFGGNIGKLYNTAIPVLDFRLIYFFDFRLAGEIGVSSASHSYVVNAGDIGAVDVNLLRANADLKYYFDTKNMGATITAVNPYVVAGIGQTFRTRVYHSSNQIDKDTALVLDGGFGMEFALKPRKTSLGVEARYHQFYFGDRNDGRYQVVGVNDTTGPMYSFITSLIFFF